MGGGEHTNLASAITPLPNTLHLTAAAPLHLTAAAPTSCRPSHQPHVSHGTTDHPSAPTFYARTRTSARCSRSWPWTQWLVYCADLFSELDTDAEGAKDTKAERQSPAVPDDGPTEKTGLDDTLVQVEDSVAGGDDAVVGPHSQRPHSTQGAPCD